MRGRKRATPAKPRKPTRKGPPVRRNTEDDDDEAEIGSPVDDAPKDAAVTAQRGIDAGPPR